LQGVNEANALMDHDGDITNLGLQYIGAEGPDTSGSGSADGPEATAPGLPYWSGSTKIKADSYTALLALMCAMTVAYVLG
jgi:hypothetical protein